MNHRTRIAIGTAGIATVFLLLGTGAVQHLPEEPPAAPHIRPMCDVTQEVGEISLPEPQIDCTADLPAIIEEISSASDTAAGTPCTQSAPEPKSESAADTAPQAVNSTAPIRQEQQPKESASASKESAPQMGETRVVDGRKQVYFLGFGWIDDNGGGGESTVVDGDGDINKMVGDM